MLLHYLGKQKAENCVFSLKRWVVLPADTENTFILSLGHSWTALRSQKNQLYAPIKIYEGSVACYHLLTHTHHLPSLSAVIKHVVNDKIVCLSATQLMHAPVHGVCNTVQQLLRKTQLRFSWAIAPIRPELNSINYKILEVYTSVNMSLKSTKPKKSSSDWLNSGKAVIQHWVGKMRFLCFHALPDTAEALVRRGRKIKYHLTSYILDNITAGRSYSKPKQWSVLFKDTVHNICHQFSLLFWCHYCTR